MSGQLVYLMNKSHWLGNFIAPPARAFYSPVSVEVPPHIVQVEHFSLEHGIFMSGDILEAQDMGWIDTLTLSLQINVVTN